MPRLQDIERFKRDLAALSRESEILSRWGEVKEEPSPPEGAVAEPEKPRAAPRGLAAKAAALRSAASPEAAVPDEGLPPDFASLLADLPLEEVAAESEELPPLEEPEEEPAAGPEEDEELSALESFDLAAFAEPEGGAFGEETPEPQGLESFAEAEAPSEGLADGFGTDLGAGFEAEALPDLEAEAPSSATAGEPALPSELESFDLPDLEAEAPGSAPAEEPALPSELESFDLPDLGSEPLAEGAFELPAEEAFELPSEEPAALPAEEGGPEAAGAASPGPGGDEFAIPDFDLGESPAEGLPEPPSGPEKGGRAEPSSSAAGQPPSEAEPAGFDAFDSFSFEEGMTSFGEGSLGGEDLDRELASLGDEAGAAETFNLDKEWGADFEIPGEPAAAAERPAPGRRAPPPPKAPSSPRDAGAAPPRRGQPSVEERLRPVALDEGQVDRLQDRLLGLPLNLRVAVEEAVANERGTEAQRSRLVWLLVESAPIEEIASLAGRILQRRLAVPKGYEKSTGAAHEAEKGSFRYILAHTVVPVLRTALLVLACAGALGWLGWKFVYRPLAANALYRSGYERIAEDRYPDAEAAFAKAGKIRDVKAWYYRYAEAYAAKRQYILAERKYAALLARYPAETKGALDWARLEKDQLKFKEAAEILQKRILERAYHQKDALLLLGDVYLAWAEEEPKYYEEARRAYAALIERYGSEDAYLERMLLYFVRTDKLEEVLPLKDGFMSAKKLFPSADTLAELGGYLLDKDKVDEVRRVLIAAQAKDPSVPEAHYHLARYFEKAGAPAEERKALDKAVAAFARVPVLSARRLGLYVDALVRRGNFRLDAREYLAAEEDFTVAADLYGKALELRRLKRSPRYAAAYAGLAEVAYWMRDDLPAALDLLARAEAHGYDTQRARYQRGYALYRLGRFSESLEQFYRAGLLGESSPYLSFAFGCALYARADYHAAEGYFRRVVEAMELELERLDLPDPQGKATHGEIVELLMLAQNNLGASLYRVGNRLGNPAIRSKAMAGFAESARLFDAMERDQSTMARPEAKNLGFLNMDYVLHPQRGIDLAVYGAIERDMRFPKQR